MENREIIARRVAKELREGDLVNLGIGLPTEVVNYIPEGLNVMIHSENGFLGLGPKKEEDPYIFDAGGNPAGIVPGGVFFDSALSFSIVRGGHLDITVLGALEVDSQGNLANWMIPKKLVPGMGGAMDLVVGAKKVIIAMEHTVKGKPKIVEKCNLPLTAKGVVDIIVTEMGVMEVIEEGILLKEINKDYSIKEVKRLTATNLIISEDLKLMEL